LLSPDSGRVRANNAGTRNNATTEISDNRERIRTFAHSYVESPERTLIVSPDNASRRELNLAVREELKKAKGALAGRSM
jgi:hypothetical protein